MPYTRWIVQSGREYAKRLDDHARAFLALPAIERALAKVGEENCEASFEVARSIVQLVEPAVPQPPDAERVAYASQQTWLVSLIEDRDPEVVLVPDAGMQDLPSVHSFAMHVHWAVRHLDAIVAAAPERDALIDAARKALGRIFGPRGMKRGPTSAQAAIDGLAMLVEREFPTLTRAETAEVALRTAAIVGVIDAASVTKSAIARLVERAKKQRQRSEKAGKIKGIRRTPGRKTRSR